MYHPLFSAYESRKNRKAHFGNHGNSCKQRPRLTEQNFGKYEGTPEAVKNFALPKEISSAVMTAESLCCTLHKEFTICFDDVKASGKVCILVAHNGIAKVVNSYFSDMTNEEYADFGVKNCEILRYDF